MCYQSSELSARDLLSAGFSMKQLLPILERAYLEDKLSSELSGLPLRQPVSSARFHEILKELGELHDKKQRDYGSSTDPFANVRASKEWGCRPWVAALIRGSDKLRRLQRFAETGTLANESVEDSFRDLAVLAVIALVLWEEEKSRPKKVVLDELRAGDVNFEDQQCRLCGAYYEGVHTCLSSR